MKKIGFIALSLSLLASAFSCTKDGGRIPDTGDLKTGIVMPGVESVTVCVEFKEGSKASKAEITWGDAGKVSADISGGRIRQKIDVAEGSHMFRVSAFDGGGRRVVDFPMYGRSYGAAYSASLKNRVPLFELDKVNVGNLNIEWGASPAGCLRSVLKYLKAGVADSVEIAILPDAKTTVLENIVDKSSFSVRSYYYPDITLYSPETRPSSVPADFVYPEVASLSPTSYAVGVAVDVTTLYLKNAGPGIKGKDIQDSWGTPVDWKVSASLFNPKNSDKPGGWKGGDPNNGKIGFETLNWGQGAQYSITNGKLWQTADLPKGSYRLSIGYQGNYGTKIEDRINLNLVVAAGSELPDVGALASNALAFRKITLADDQKTLEVTFTLTETTQLSMGLALTLDATEGPVGIDVTEAFKLEKLP